MPSSTGINMQELECKIPIRSDKKTEYIGDDKILKIISKVGSEDEPKPFT